MRSNHNFSVSKYIVGLKYIDCKMQVGYDDINKSHTLERRSAHDRNLFIRAAYSVCQMGYLDPGCIRAAYETADSEQIYEKAGADSRIRQKMACLQLEKLKYHSIFNAIHSKGESKNKDFQVL